MLKETFSMRKIGKHLVNVSMLSLAIAPVVGSALAPVTVLAEESKSGQDGSNKLTRTEEIPFKTETKEDPTLATGEKKVIQKGEKGVREFTTISDKSSINLAKESTAKKNEDGSYTQTLVVESNPTAQTVVKPLDLMLIFDGSGSLVGKLDTGNGKPTERVIDLALKDAKALVNSLPDGSRVMMMSYGENNATSYKTDTYTKMLSKADMIKMLDDLIALSPKMTYDFYRVWAPYAKEHADKFMPFKDREYEDAYKEVTDKLDTMSIAQFTDGWVQNVYNNGGWLTEQIDSSFATWAKANAKTFMSIVYPTEEDYARYSKTKENEPWSVLKMKEAGHPNIYNAFKIPNEKRTKDIIDAFKNTALVKAPVSGSLTITPESGIDVKSVSVITPSGKTVDSIKTLSDLSKLKNFDEKGAYKVSYTFVSSNLTKDATISSKLVIGDKSDTKVDKFVMSTVKGSTSDKVIKEPINEIIHIGTKGSKSEVVDKKVPFETIYKQDATLKKGEEKVLQEGVEGLIKVTTTYETQKGQKVDGSEKVTEETVTEKVDKIIAQGTMEKRKIRYRVVDSKGQELVKQTDVMEAYQDEEYKVETPKLDGYRLELAKDSVPATGKVADRDVLVTFVAVKIGKPVTLKFVDEAGTEIAQKKVLTGENVDVDAEFKGEAPATIEKDGIKYVFVGIKQTGSKERKVSGKVTDKEQVIEAVYAKPKELPKTNEQAKQRNTVIVALLSVVGLGGLVTYFGLRKRDEK